VGQRVDVPMFEGMLSVVLGEHLAGELFDPAHGPAGYQRSLARDRRPYRTADGHVCVMVYNDKQWQAFFDAIGRPEVFAQDARFSSQGLRLEHIDHVYGYLSEVLASRTTAEWLALFAGADIPAARMYSVHDVLADEHVTATGFVQMRQHPSEGSMRETAVPTEWSGTPPGRPRHAPRLGENSVEVLREFGLTAGEIDALLAQGTVR
ncbi:MAG: CoA transferase, partial [Haliea sp.]